MGFGSNAGGKTAVQGDLRYTLVNQAFPASRQPNLHSMPNVAIAFHEQDAMEKLNRYFGSDNAGISESRALCCRRCSVAFAVVLVDRADTRNPEHLNRLLALIEDDCSSGLHEIEYVLRDRE